MQLLKWDNTIDLGTVITFAVVVIGIFRFSSRLAILEFKINTLWQTYTNSEDDANA